MNPMLRIEDLVQVYPGGVRALDSVSLSIPPGVFGLLGPNGAGKSSLMRCIATLQTPSSGAIHFGGIDVLRDPEALRATLGYLPQDFGVYPRVSAYDLLDHLAVLKGIAGRAERRETVETLLVQVNLWEARKRPVARFSGGMRQRFGIAQALIGRPALLIVDEPTAGLDPEERNRCLDLLAGTGEERVVILSTHIVEDVADLCPRMAVMAAGRILLEGAPRELIARMAGRVWRKTVARDEVATYAAAYRVISTRLFAGNVVLHVDSAEDPGAGFEPVTGSLEDVYFHTLGLSRRAA